MTLSETLDSPCCPCCLRVATRIDISPKDAWRNLPLHENDPQPAVYVYLDYPAGDGPGHTGWRIRCSCVPWHNLTHGYGLDTIPTIRSLTPAAVLDLLEAQAAVLGTFGLQNHSLT